MSLKSISKIVLVLFARAAWAPILIFILHGLFSGIIPVYKNYPWSDMPMHYFGGMSIAYAYSTIFAALPEGLMTREVRPYAEAILVISLTTTTAVIWEFGEYTSDAVFGTHALDVVHDTLQDLALGMAGAVTYVLIAGLLGKLGRYRPVRQ